MGAKTWQETVMSKEDTRIWDKELLDFFQLDVFSPSFELETYGLDVAKSRLKSLVT